MSIIDKAVLDKVKAEVVSYSAKSAVLAKIDELEAGLKHIEANLDTFAAHEKAAVQQWLLDVKNRVRSLLSRIV